MAIAMHVYSILAEAIVQDIVEIEYHSRFQIPSFQILGLPAPEIQEARERIMAAFQAAGLEFPKKKVIINLAPASIKKSGTGYDFSIALKIISEISEHEWPISLLAWGELSLDGLVKPCGKIATLIDLLLRKFPDQTPPILICSTDFLRLEALLKWRESKKLPVPKDLKIQIVDQLSDLNAPLNLKSFSIDASKSNPAATDPAPENLLSLPKRAERVLKLSLIGKHHVLLLGPKGIGKSESLRWYQALLPDSLPEQTWQRILISENRDLPLDFASPIRRVHAQVRPAHLLGTFREKGYQPGELALAHGGLFIADEFMEWPRDSKESLREPLQSKKIFLTRVKGQMECPADFQMIATGNLCPCGGLPPPYRGGLPAKKFKCRCRTMDIDQYLTKLSGPILDRIDLTYIMAESERKKLPAGYVKILRTEIQEARQFAVHHFGALPSELAPEWLDANLPKESEKLLAEVTSLRARHKILRVARSIQALEKSKTLEDAHLFEAKWFRLNTEMN